MQRAEEQGKERLINDVLSVDSLPLEWTAYPRAQEVRSPLDNLPNFREATLRHIGIQTSKFHNLISGNYNVFHIIQNNL